MDNELTKILAEKFGLAFDYVEQNFQDVFSRYVRYRITINSIFLAIGIALILCLIVWLSLCLTRRKIKGSIFRDEIYTADTISEMATVVLIILAILAFVGLVLVIKCGSNLIGWTMCPEMKMLEALTQ